MQDMQEGAYPKKKKKIVADQFASSSIWSETYYWSPIINREDYGADKYWVFVFLGRLRFKKR